MTIYIFIYISELLEGGRVGGKDRILDSPANSESPADIFSGKEEGVRNQATERWNPRQSGTQPVSQGARRFADTQQPSILLCCPAPAAAAVLQGRWLAKQPMRSVARTAQWHCLACASDVRHPVLKVCSVLLMLA